MPATVSITAGMAKGTPLSTADTVPRSVSGPASRTSPVNTGKAKRRSRTETFHMMKRANETIGPYEKSVRATQATSCVARRRWVPTNKFQCSTTGRVGAGQEGDGGERRKSRPFGRMVLTVAFSWGVWGLFLFAKRNSPHSLGARAHQVWQYVENHKLYNPKNRNIQILVALPSPVV